MISKDSVILKQYKNSKSIDLQSIIIDIAKKYEKLILDIHRDQLRRGEAGDGKMPKYFASYLNYKESLSSYYSSPNADLFVTGNLQDKEFIRFDDKEWEISSSASYVTDLLDNDRYGERIFELNKLSYELVQEQITPLFNKRVHELLNK